MPERDRRKTRGKYTWRLKESGLFSGNTAADLNTREFFKDNRFYTTTAARISSGFDDNAVTDEDVIRFCKENVK